VALQKSGRHENGSELFGGRRQAHGPVDGAEAAERGKVPGTFPVSQRRFPHLQQLPPVQRPGQQPGEMRGGG